MAARSRSLATGRGFFHDEIVGSIANELKSTVQTQANEQMRRSTRWLLSGEIENEEQN
jgi:hypothetical protein